MNMTLLMPDLQAIERQRQIGERMARVRLLRYPRLDQEDVGLALGVSRGVVANWEIGRTAQPEKAISYYSANFNVSREWLLTGTGAGPREPDRAPAGPNPPGSNPPTPQFDRVAQPGVGRRLFPLIGSVQAGSYPAFESDNPDDWEDFSDGLYNPAYDQLCTTVRGDSGEPTIRHGDVVLFNRMPGFQTPGFYVIVAHRGEGALVKILRRAKPGSPHELELVPENPNYPVVPIDDDQYRMVGPIIGQKRKGRRSYVEIGDPDGLRPDSNEWRTR